MSTNDELLATIDAKLSALLKVAVEDQARGATSGPAVPADVAASLGALFAVNGSPVAQPAAARPLATTGGDLSEALDEIARLLALSLKRKRDLADVVADLDSVGFDRARIHLGYGEYLRRTRRRVDARTHLRTALHTFDELGATRWAERATVELRASGETARRRDVTTTIQFTPQERQVATLVKQGLSNKDIAAQLFVSPRTVDFHLRNVFAKTGISSRGELTTIAVD